MQRIQISSNQCNNSGSCGQPTTGRFCDVIRNLKNSRGRFVKLHYSYPKSKNSIAAKYVSNTDRSVTIYNSQTRSNMVLPLSRLTDLRVG